LTSLPAIGPSGQRLCLVIGMLDSKIEGILAARDAAEVVEIGRSDSEVLRFGSMFLKIAPLGKLKRAAVMQEYFWKKGLSAPLAAFSQDGGRDYLLVEAVPGKSGVALLDRPEWLAERLGEAVRALHEIDASDCPLADVNEMALELYARENGRAFPGDASALRKDALVHGDCCLPNVFFSERGFSGFIDLGEGGLGDRHFDLFWALWSLQYNLKTDAYAARFLDAYGRDAVDPVRLDCCTRISRWDD